MDIVGQGGCLYIELVNVEYPDFFRSKENRVEQKIVLNSLACNIHRISSSSVLNDSFGCPCSVGRGFDGDLTDHR